MVSVPTRKEEVTTSQAAPVKPGPIFRGFLAYQRWADNLAEITGKGAQWAVIPTVAVGFINVVLRYVGQWRGIRLTSNAVIELQWYLYSLIFLLGFNYILKHQINVRVDFWFANQSKKRKAMIDFFGHMIALIPFAMIGLWVSIPQVVTSWSLNEQSPDADGLPRAPIKTMIAVAFALLLIQAFAEMVKLYTVLVEPEELAEVEEELEQPTRIE